NDGRCHRASSLRLDLVRRLVLGMAHAATLRAGVTVARLASPRARLLLRDRHVVLAAGDPRLARPIAVAAVDDDPVPAAGRSAEHGPRGDPDLLRPGDLPGVRDDPARGSHRSTR